MAEGKAGPEGADALQSSNKRDRAVIPEKLIEHLLKTMVGEWDINIPIQLNRTEPAEGKLFESEPAHAKRGAESAEAKQPASKKPKDEAFDAWVGAPTSMTGRQWLHTMISTFGLMTVEEYVQRREDKERSENHEAEIRTTSGQPLIELARKWNERFKAVARNNC